MAPEQQPAASSLASAASHQKLAELTQPKAAAEVPASDALCGRSSAFALASNAASVPSAFEDAPSTAATEPASADDARSGELHRHMQEQSAAVSTVPSYCYLPMCLHTQLRRQVNEASVELQLW